MPQKKKGHGHRKTPQETKEYGKDTACGHEDHHSSRSSAYYPTTWSYTDKSQPSKATPKPAAQVSTVKPAQFEKASSGSAMAAKPEVVTTATGEAAGSGVTAGGSAAVGTARKDASKAKPETNTTLAGATVIDMTSAGASGGPREMSKIAPVSQVKTRATVPSVAGTAAAASTATTAAVAKAKESPKGTAKSATAATTVKASVPKVDPAKTSKPAAAAMAAAGKVQVEVPAPTVKGAKEASAVDPFDALASSLPTADPVVRPQPVYTGPEVKEHGITSEKGQKCGERDDTLPPDYRFKDVGPRPADLKPEDVPKPLSTDEALDSLSSGFMTSTVPTGASKEKKKGHADIVSASSAGTANFAPPPVKKPETPAAVTSVVAPPADKKPKMDDFSLEGALSAPATTQKSVPLEAQKAAAGKDKTVVKPKITQGSSMSSDALSSLGDLLPADVPKPKEPEVRPEDIVSEDKHEKEKGVLVGEREDTLPPEYRFNEEELKKLPAPKPEPTMATGEALDFLSEGFSTPSAAPAQKSPAPPADKKAKVQEGPGDFSLEGALSSTTATTQKSDPAVAVCHVPANTKPGKTAAGKDNTDGKSKATQGGSMSSDALSSLGDLLPADVPKPKEPEVRPEDIVSEDKHKKEKGVLVGEREDALPPEYRFNEKELKKLPAPKPEPTIGTGEALDFLSEGFSTPSAAPVVKPPVVPPTIPPCEVTIESALDLPSSDIVSSSTASGVHASFPPPPKKTPGKADVAPVKPQGTKPKADKVDSMSPDAFSALSDLLPEAKPKPESPKLRPEDIVSEDKHKKEKGVLVGEREDTLPPEYRFNEEELKKLPAPKPEPTIGTGEALDFLSEGFTTPSAAPVVKAPVVPPTIPPCEVTIESGLDLPSSDIVSSSTASGVHASVPPPPKKTPGKADVAPVKPQGTKPKADKVDSMSPDAFSALSDLLPEAKPKPESPKLRPEDIVSEDKHKKEKGVLVGEREDTLPPEYRFNEEELKKLPPPKPEPTIGTGEALDFLSEGFTTPSAAPVVKAPVVPPTIPPCEVTVESLSALDLLSSDIVSSSTASGVHASVPPPPKETPGLAAAADNALDALSDTLKDIKPTPQPAPVPTKDTVKEKKIVEEKLIKMGERDDTLPPEYRPTEEDLKKMAEEKEKQAAAPKKKGMDDKTALDLLSSDFSDTPKVAAPVASSGATTKLQPPVLDSEPLKPMAGVALDSLAGSLLPDNPEFKSKTDKPKGKSKSKSKSKKHHAEDPSAADQLSAQLSSDVVPTSTKKGGKS